MSFPQPKPGQVIRYSYLWKKEAEQGQEEGLKDRPAAIVLVTKDDQNEQIVTVLPITHTPPRDITEAIEIPSQTKRRLGLDDDRSWVVLTEVNRFIWPGPDLRMSRRGEPESVLYGYLPANFFDAVKERFIALVKARKAKLVKRSE